MIDDNEERECPACGEVHAQTLAEEYFIRECEERGLPVDGSVVPPKARMAVTMSSVILAPLHGMCEDDPSALTYYAAALAALSKMAKDQAEEMFAEANGGAEAPDTIPDGWETV